MAKFAYIVDGQIDSVYDLLPDNWKNISNFCLLADDEPFLNSLGWHRINNIIPAFDPAKQRLDEVRRWIDENGVVNETEEVIDLPPPPSGPTQEELTAQQWNLVRQQRDSLSAEFDWRVVRHARQTRLGITPTDDIKAIDTYAQALADLPDTQTDPFNIVWPVFTNGVTA